MHGSASRLWEKWLTATHRSDDPSFLRHARRIRSRRLRPHRECRHRLILKNSFRRPLTWKKQKFFSPTWNVRDGRIQRLTFTCKRHMTRGRTGAGLPRGAEPGAEG